MRICTLLLLFCSYSLSAQINLLIEDQTDQGFFLGVNGYLQNPEKKKNLVVKDLDTIPYVLHIDSDTSNFTKTIHLREKKTHKYVLTRNFKGELKLRYRGEQSGTPKGYEVVSLDRSVAWPEEWKPRHIKKDKEPELTASGSSSANQSFREKEDPQDTGIVSIETHSTDEEPQELLLPGNDTVAVKSRTLEVTEPEFDTPPFEQLIANLKETEFEFEKLVKSRKYAEEHILSTDQLREVFSVLSYDNSRLQLLKAAKKKILDPNNLGNLKDVFEYEVTQRQFQKIIDEE